MKFEELDKDRKILNLEAEAMVQEVKDSFHKLAKETHPDVAKDKNKEKAIERFREISWAYEVIMNYLFHYKFSFKEEDFNKKHLDLNRGIKDHMNRFFDNWLGDLSI
ncbi:MAG: DnaJ domain-containing protein [Candidatus Kaelpia imicola]|nr:DnaJ domain-containing protein [Candidatus Kaelpia imicola]